MSRENKKETVAMLHREQIMLAAEEIFSRKGFLQTTISDISKASNYSRRTIYAYYESKEDILHHIIEKGLLALKKNIKDILNEKSEFIPRYFDICKALKNYHQNYPHSLESVNQTQTEKLDFDNLPVKVKAILTLGTEINELLAQFIDKGKNDGIVCDDIVTMQTVYILWVNITSLLTLVQTKGNFLTHYLKITEEDFLDRGFRQIINSILNKRV